MEEFGGPDDRSATTAIASAGRAPTASYQPLAGDCGDEYIQRLIGDLSSENPQRVLRAQLCMQPGAYACSTPEIDQMVDIASVGAGRGRGADRRRRPGRLHHGPGAPRERRGAAQGPGPALLPPAGIGAGGHPLRRRGRRGPGGVLKAGSRVGQARR